MNIPAASRRLRPSKCARACPALSIPSISGTARSSNRATSCSRSTSAPTSSRSNRPKPISNARAPSSSSRPLTSKEQRRFVQTQVVTGREFDTRKSTQRDAAAGVASSDAALKQAQLNLEWTEVRAPIAGRISDRRVDAGNLISGGETGATLLTVIVSLDPIHFVFDGSEADFLRYSRLEALGSRPSSRNVQRSGRGQARRREPISRIWAGWISSTTCSIRRPARSAAAPSSTTRTGC